jgi:drug/metabolite transporter (DMT)-like permease
MTTFTEIAKPSNRFIIYAIILITLFEATGQLCLKKFTPTSSNSYNYFLLGILFYMLVCGLLCYCYAHKGHLGSVNLMWSCMSIIFVIVVGYVFLQERPKTHDFIAIFFALLAIYFANMD